MLYQLSYDPTAQEDNRTRVLRAAVRSITTDRVRAMRSDGYGGSVTTALGVLELPVRRATNSATDSRRRKDDRHDAHEVTRAEE